MNLLIVAESLRQTEAGAAHATLGFTNEIAKRKDIRVCVYTSDVEEVGLDPACQIVKYPEPPPLRVFWRFDHIMRYYLFLDQLRRHDFGHIDICYTQNHLHGLAFRTRFPRVPMVSHTGGVLTGREYLEESRSGETMLVHFNARLANWMEARAYKANLWTHIVSTRLVAEIREAHFKLPKGFFHICPFAVNHSTFKPHNGPGYIRKQLGIPNDAIVIISVSRLVPWKNTSMIISALAHIHRDDLYLLVLGEGREKNFLVEQAKDLGIGNNCFFMGHVEAPSPYYAESDIFVLPSTIESFGIVYAEAMACGLPCIGLRNNPPEVLSSAIDVMEEGKSGYCVSSQQELVEKLLLLIHDDSIRKKMGGHALMQARKRFTWTNYVDKFLSILDEGFQIAV